MSENVGTREPTHTASRKMQTGVAAWKNDPAAPQPYAQLHTQHQWHGAQRFACDPAKAVDDGSSAWTPATRVEEPVRSPGSWLHAGLAVAFYTGNEPEVGSLCSFSLSLSLPPNTF